MQFLKSLAGLSLITLVSVSAGCGDGSFVLAEVNGAPLVFNLGTDIRAMASGRTLTLQFNGSSGVANVPDGSSSALMVVELDMTPLVSSTLGQQFEIIGNANFVGPMGSFMELPTFTPSSGHSPMVRRAWVRQSCFCPSTPGIENVRGAIVFRTIQGSRIAGHVRLTVTGMIPGFFNATTVTMDSTFDEQF